MWNTARHCEDLLNFRDSLLKTCEEFSVAESIFELCFLSICGSKVAQSIYFSLNFFLFKFIQNRMSIHKHWNSQSGAKWETFVQFFPSAVNSWKRRKRSENADLLFTPGPGCGDSRTDENARLNRNWKTNWKLIPNFYVNGWRQFYTQFEVKGNFAQLFSLLIGLYFSSNSFWLIWVIFVRCACPYLFGYLLSLFSCIISASVCWSSRTTGNEGQNHSEASGE